MIVSKGLSRLVSRGRVSGNHKGSVSRFFLYTYIIAFAVCLEFTFDSEARNLLNVGLMALSPLIILSYSKSYKIDSYLIVFMCSIILFPAMIHDEPVRWSTIIYTCLFCLSFMAFIRVYKHSKFLLDDYLKLLKFLLYAYVMVLIIQQMSVLLGLPVFNLRNYNPSDPWKLNSLGAEPSWSGRIVALLMYCYISMKEVADKVKYDLKTELKKDWRLWGGFLWAMLSMGSATAVLFLAIVTVKFVKPRNFLIATLLVIGVFVTSMFGGVESESLLRVEKTVVATLTLDERAIIEADHSASFRIVPFIHLFKLISLSDTRDIFGYGVDYVLTDIDFGIGGVVGDITGGGFLVVLVEYGWIAFLALVVMSIYVSWDRRDPISIAFWFLLVLMYPINVQIPWLAMMLLYLNKKFKRRYFSR